MTRKTAAKGLLAVLAVLVLWACGSPQPFAQSQKREGRIVTAAEIFEQMVKSMQERKREIAWDKRRNAANPYDMIEVKVEDWLATPEGKFAHSIKIPNPVPADSGYRPGMTQQEYFEHLCKNEAGEFIFKTADNVEGIYQIRPRRVYSHGEWAHLYALEDPYGYWVGEHEDLGAPFSLVTPRLYDYLEMPVSGRPKYGIEWKILTDPSMVAEPPVRTNVAR